MRNTSLSPFKSGIYGAQDSIAHKIRSLEQQIMILNQENSLFRGKVKKVNELEEKIEMVLRHNTNLLNENEQLSRLLNQRKSESDLLKTKYEALVMQSSTSNEIEVKKLKNEIDKLNDEIIEMDRLKKLEIGDMRAQLSHEIQYVKKGNISSLETAEFQYRKLKEICDSKDYEISELSIKMNRIVKDTEIELLRLKDEKERLRKEIEIQQEEHRRDVANLKAKFDSNLHLEVENLKKQHLNQVDALAFENAKIKDLTTAKNAEIEQILSKNMKNKQNYQEEILLLKRENEALKDKLMELERFAQLEIANLREKQENMRESEISLLKSAHINQIEILSNQVRTLEDIIATKNQEIEGLIKERNQNRIFFESEIKKLKLELEASILDNKDAQQVYDVNLTRLEKEIKAKDEENRVLVEAFTSQINTLKDELNLVQELLRGKTAEFDNFAKEAQLNEKNLNRRIKDLEKNLDDLNYEHDRSKGQSSTELGDVKKLYDSRIQNLTEQIRSLEEQNQQKNGIIATLKQTIEVKDGESDTQAKNIGSLERMLGKARKDLEENKQRSLNKEAEYNKITKEQRQRMTTTFEFQLSNVRNEHNNQVSGLKLNIADLKKQLQQKTNKLDELRKMYEKLVKETERVLTDEARRKELDIKQPGWLPDTISTKGLFDVFMKNKVIEWCDV